MAWSTTNSGFTAASHVNKADFSAITRATSAQKGAALSGKSKHHGYDMDMPLALTRNSPATKGLWRNGSASDSRSEGWEFESLWPHISFCDAAPLPWQCHVTMACQRSHAPSLCGTSQYQYKSCRIPCTESAMV